VTVMVLIYNAGGVEVHDVKPMRHVVTMLHRGVARVLEADGEAFGPFVRPRSVELVRYVYARWRYERTAPATYSFKGVLLRDRHTCAYCGRSATTIDHVVPRCQQGRSTWTNSVAACRDCNERKGGRTPAQAGMRLMWEPTQPGVSQAVRHRHRAR
jgi:5-methylcytosine-specific restriction endonuclease McrA